MKNLFKPNDYGHNTVLWNYCVRGNARKRAWYARRLGRSLGAPLERRRTLASRLQARDDGMQLPADDGFNVFAPGTFPDVAAIVSAANNLVSSGQQKSGRAGTKAFLAQGFLPQAQLTPQSPFLRFALSNEVVTAVASYLGTLPILQQMDVWKSDNTRTRWRASQRYHCDWDDTTQVKVFVYCSHVDLASGPLTLIDAAASDTLRHEVGYTYDRKRYRVDDPDADAVVPKHRQHAITGSPGTVVFADTSRCFHYGSRVLEGGQSRIVANYQFVTPTSFLYPPQGYFEHAPYRPLADDSLTEVQRFVLGADS